MTKFYLMTGYVPDADKVDLSVFDGILTKPFVLHSLYRMVDVEKNKGAKVMVVDDETVVGRLALEALKQAGMQASLYSSPQKALEEYPSLKPDIVLTDYVMPGMTGLELRKNMLELNSL